MNRSEGTPLAQREEFISRTEMSTFGEPFGLDHYRSLCMWTILALAVAGGAAIGGGDQDWQKLETPYLKNIRQVTSDFVRAGEGYFSPDGGSIIFQAEEKGEN